MAQAISVPPEPRLMAGIVAFGLRRLGLFERTEAGGSSKSSATRTFPAYRIADLNIGDWSFPSGKEKE